MNQVSSKIKISVKTKISATIIFLISSLFFLMDINITYVVLPLILAGYLVFRKKFSLYWVGIEAFLAILSLIFIWNFINAGILKLNYELFFGIFLMLVAVSLGSGKKYGWWAGIVALFLLVISPILLIVWLPIVGMVLWFLVILVLISLSALTALLLLLIDRKNYFAAVEKARDKAGDDSGLTK